MEFQKFYVEFSSLVRFGGSVRFLTKNGRKFGSAGFPTMPRFGLSLLQSDRPHPTNELLTITNGIKWPNKIELSTPDHNRLEIE